MPDDFKQAIEEVKLRNPIEDVVRELVPDLKRSGALWVACCPFHEEKTPSFKVDPRRGTWHCYGACAMGGDSISFVERHSRVEFLTALDILAARAGVQLPDRRSQDRAKNESENQAAYALMKRAEDLFRRQLHGERGSAALAYVRDRGLDPATLDAFGVGYASAGSELVSRAIDRGVRPELLEAVGLARRDSSGRLRDFFHDRLMIPVRDLKGRTVGFGARRLTDGDPRSPKYINTPETRLFHKGQLIYGLDLALDHTRREGHLVLVEGYTDVMAAHQVGVRIVAAVLGTSTTDQHAGLVRRTGARRVSLVFDGDEAGRRATLRALHGLLPLGISVDIVRLPGNADPCDTLLGEGAEAFAQHLEAATGWFDFMVEGLLALPAEERWREVDKSLELILRLPKPMQRDERLEALARGLGTPVEGVRAQFDSLPERRRAERQRQRQRHDAEEAAAEQSLAQEADRESEVDEGEAGLASERPQRRRQQLDPRVALALSELAGAALLQPALAPGVEPFIGLCPEGDLRRVLAAIVATLPEADPESGVDAVLTALADDTARNCVVPLLEDADHAEDAESLFEGAVSFLNTYQEQRRIREGIQNLERESDAATHLKELHQRLRARVI